MVLSAPVIIVVSEVDEAGVNMRKALYNLLPFEETDFIAPETWPSGKYKAEFTSNRDICLLSIPEKQIYTEYFEGRLTTNLLIFASKHYSQTGKKTLLVHPVGNWGEVDMGSGLERTVCIAPAFALYRGMLALDKYKQEVGLDDYWVGLEVTHHGPSINLPVIFMEAGGSAEEWNDPEATEVVARAIVDVAIAYVSNEFEEQLDTFIGIGGGHYAPPFIKRVRKKLLMIGHMVPKYKSKDLDEEMIKQAYERTLGKRKFFLLDKKGLRGAERRRLGKLIEKLGYEYKLTTDFS